MDALFMNPDYRGGPEAYLKHYAIVMARRAALLSSRRATKKQLRDLFMEALDGEFPEDAPLFVAEWFKGHRNPMAVAKRWERLWMKEGG